MMLWLSAAENPTPPPVIPPDISTHRHRNSAGKYVNVRDGTHRHADLEARIKALEDYVKSRP